MNNLDLAGWLAELRFQQRHRSHEITEDELRRSWDRYLDAMLEKGRLMTNDDPDPAWHAGHVELSSGEIVTVHCTDDESVVLALYAIPEETESGGDDALVQPAPVVAMTPNEAELLGSLLGAVSAHNQRPALAHKEIHGDPPTAPRGENDA